MLLTVVFHSSFLDVLMGGIIIVYIKSNRTQVAVYF